jgi:hypothetical protein
MILWELCNSLSMFGPAAVLAYCLLQSPCSPALAIVCYAVALQAPFSITYHVCEGSCDLSIFLLCSQ